MRRINAYGTHFHSIVKTSDTTQRFTQPRGIISLKSLGQIKNASLYDGYSDVTLRHVFNIYGHIHPTCDFHSTSEWEPQTLKTLYHQLALDLGINVDLTKQTESDKNRNTSMI